MRVRWLEHAEYEGLGCIEPWLARQGYRAECTRLHAGDVPPPPDDYDALIVMGGPMNIYEYERHPWLREEKRAIREAIDAGKRVLGICLGAQLIADVLGGPVRRNDHQEIGWFPVTLTAEGIASKQFEACRSPFIAFHWHGDTYALPPGAVHLARSEACAQQSFAYGSRVLGLQFHLEVRQADAAEWFRHGRPRAAAYVQPAEYILEQRDLFEQNNRTMRAVLERFFA